MITGFLETVDSRSFGYRFTLAYYGKPFLYNYIIFILKVRKMYCYNQSSKFYQLSCV